MATPDKRNYYGASESIISDATKKETAEKDTGEKADEKINDKINDKTVDKTKDEVQPPAKAGAKAPKLSKNKRFQIVRPIKRKIRAMKDWASDRQIRMRVYNDDFIKDIPPLYITRIIMDDEINLDTDEDRGYLAPNVKKIVELGGTPAKLEPVNDSLWDEFLPKARSPIHKSALKPKV